MTKIRVGVVGASANGSWGSRAHIPALHSLDAYEIVGVATNSAATAQASAAAFAIPRAFDSVQDLVESPDVDLVSVCVRVPHHVAVISAALAAGKHVYCEWPLTVTTAEAEAMAALAARSGGATAIGLQARVDPALVHARELIADGAIGEVHGVSLTYSSPWPVALPAAYALMQDARSGLSQVELSCGHTLDALCWLLGEFESVSATFATRVPSARSIDTCETVPRTSPDQIVVQGLLDSGAVLSAHIGGAPGSGTGTRIEIQGTTGSLLLTSPSREAIQSAAPRLASFRKGKTEEIAIPAECARAPQAPSGVPANVANMYAAFADAIGAGSRFEHDFDAALQRHRMLDSIRQAAGSGSSVRTGK